MAKQKKKPKAKKKKPKIPRAVAARPEKDVEIKSPEDLETREAGLLEEPPTRPIAKAGIEVYGERTEFYEDIKRKYETLRRVILNGWGRFKKRFQESKGFRWGVIGAGVLAGVLVLGSNLFPEPKIPRPKKLSVIEQIVEIEPYIEPVSQSAEPKTGESFLLCDEDELKTRRQLNAGEISSKTNRRITDSSFAEYSFSPRSTDFKIYAAALSKADAEKPGASEAIELTERLMSPEDSLYKEGSVASVIGESDSHYFAYLGFVSPAQVAKWAEQDKIPDDSKEDIEDFAQRFESVRTLARESGRIVQEQSLDYAKPVSKARTSANLQGLERFLINDPELKLVKCLSPGELGSALNLRFQDSCFAVYNFSKNSGNFRIYAVALSKNELPQKYIEELNEIRQSQLELARAHAQMEGRTEIDSRDYIEGNEKQIDSVLSLLVRRLIQTCMPKDIEIKRQAWAATLVMESGTHYLIYMGFIPPEELAKNSDKYSRNSSQVRTLKAKWLALRKNLIGRGNLSRENSISQYFIDAERFLSERALRTK